MTTYVDNMRARLGRLVMCHMVADTEVELHEMARAIGVKRQWHQGDHYDICMKMKALAVVAGALQITQRECGCMVMRRRIEGTLGPPAEAIAWVRQHLAAERIDSDIGRRQVRLSIRRQDREAGSL